MATWGSQTWGLDHGKRHDRLVTGEKVIAVTIGQFLIAALLQLRYQIQDGVSQSQPDHMTGGRVGRYRQIEIRASRLDAGRNMRCGIDQCAIPVENHQSESLRSRHDRFRMGTSIS